MKGDIAADLTPSALAMLGGRLLQPLFDIARSLTVI
jgi:hypothetical protein